MQARFQACLKQLPDTLSSALYPYLDNTFAGYLNSMQVQQLKVQSLLDEKQLMFNLLPIAAAMASAPISQFNVGAIAKGVDGDLYFGANMEFPKQALFHSIHAEQSAISHAWLKSEKQIVELVVNASPCGHCRQFINELPSAADIQIHLPEQASQSLSYYLPYAFGPKDLNVSTSLLATKQEQLQLNTQDREIKLALAQAQLSYAPYSGNYAGVILVTNDGSFFAGRYAENAAFNPSMLPMQMALNNLHRHNRSADDIVRAILLETKDSKISLLTESKLVLSSISQINLEHFNAEIME